MKLTHHTRKPFKLDRSVKYSTYSEAPGKPDGLWVSVDNDWKRWCNSENFGKSNLAHKCTITLKKKAKVLRIKSKKQLQQFHENFGGADKYSNINWAKVKEQYQGIIIAPYVWECRLKLFWYYTWDCASGCIWDLKAIK